MNFPERLLETTIFAALTAFFTALAQWAIEALRERYGKGRKPREDGR